MICHGVIRFGWKGGFTRTTQSRLDTDWPVRMAPSRYYRRGATCETAATGRRPVPRRHLASMVQGGFALHALARPPCFITSRRIRVTPAGGALESRDAEDRH